MSELPKILNLKERAEEDIYFARLDREIIEKLHRQAAGKQLATAQKAENSRPQQDQAQQVQAFAVPPKR
jgi:uncharacterized protein YdaU (DUF1376 family)